MRNVIIIFIDSFRVIEEQKILLVEMNGVNHLNADNGLVILNLALNKWYEKATNQTARCSEQENHLTGKKISRSLQLCPDYESLNQEFRIYAPISLN